jgi:hypothetical protein
MLGKEAVKPSATGAIDPAHGFLQGLTAKRHQFGHILMNSPTA